MLKFDFSPFGSVKLNGHTFNFTFPFLLHRNEHQALAKNIQSIDEKINIIFTKQFLKNKMFHI